MPVIVQHLKTKKVFVLLGASYSYFKDSRPSFLGGVLFPHEEEGEFTLAAVSDAKGEIGWFPTRELKVVEVDGKSPGDILANCQDAPVEEDENKDLGNGYEECPGCGEKIRFGDRVCPHCELTLIDEEAEK